MTARADAGAPAAGGRAAGPAHRSPVTGVAAVVTATAAWGLGTAISKEAIGRGLEPTLLLGEQLLVASVVLGTVVVLSGRWRALIGPPREVLRVAWAGLIEPGVAAQLYTLGLSLTAAGTASVIFSAEPVLVVLIAWATLHERPSAGLLALCTLTLVGVMLVVLPEDDQEATRLAGVALVAAGTLGAAVRGILASRLVATTAPLPLTFLHHVVGLLVAVFAIGIGAVVTGGIERPDTADAWLVGGVSGVIQYALPFWLYLVGLRHLRVSVASQFLALIPVFGVGFSQLLLDEVISGRQLTGVVIVLLALVGVARFEAREHEGTLATPPWGDPEVGTDDPRGAMLHRELSGN